MPRFFCRDIFPNSNTLCISGEDAKHIACSLRMKCGDSLIVCDGKGMDYNCLIRSMSAECLTLEILGYEKSRSEPSVSTSIYFALPKGDKAEFIMQKAVELGAAKIIPFLSERCISRPDLSVYGKKQARYSKIVEEAAKQCGRGIIPEVLPIQSFQGALEQAVLSDIPLFLYENEKNYSIKQALSVNNFNTVSIVSGPEGGFSENEVKLAQDAGLISTTIGKRILRCETAPLAALCVVMYESGNLQ